MSYASSNFARWLSAGTWPRASETYWAWCKATVRRLLESADVWVVSWPEDKSTIVAWCVSSPGCIHYVYTLASYRRQGVASKLLAPFVGQPATLTHQTRAGHHLVSKLGADVWLFDPRHAYEVDHGSCTVHPVS